MLILNLSFFFNFSKCTKSGPKTVSGTKMDTLKKNYTKCSKLIFICSIHKYTCELQYLNTIREPTGKILYIVSTFRRVWILWICHKKCKECFCFWGEPFQWRFPSCHLYRSPVCSAHRRHYFCFLIFVFYFASVFVFIPLYDFYVLSEQKTYILFAKLLMKNPCVIEKYIVNVT